MDRCDARLAIGDVGESVNSVTAVSVALDCCGAVGERDRGVIVTVVGSLLDNDVVYPDFGFVTDAKLLPVPSSIRDRHFHDDDDVNDGRRLFDDGDQWMAVAGCGCRRT